MLRSALTVALVASLAAWIARAERRGAEPPGLTVAAALATETSWVRTADGWQPRGVLAVEPPAEEPIHPGLVAGFQLAFSLLVLIAFPGQAKPAVTRREGRQASTPLSVEPSARKRRRRISRPVSA